MKKIAVFLGILAVAFSGFFAVKHDAQASSMGYIESSCIYYGYQSNGNTFSETRFWDMPITDAMPAPQNLGTLIATYAASKPAGDRSESRQNNSTSKLAYPVGCQKYSGFFTYKVMSMVLSTDDSVRFSDGNTVRDYAGPVSAVDEVMTSHADKLTFNVIPKFRGPATTLAASVSGNQVTLAWSNPFPAKSLAMTSYVAAVERARAGSNSFVQVSPALDQSFSMPYSNIGNYTKFFTPQLTYTDTSAPEGDFDYRIRIDMSFQTATGEFYVNGGSSQDGYYAKTYHYSTVASAKLPPKAPKLASISPNSFSVDATETPPVTIAGTGFKPTGNSIKFVHATIAGKVYRIDDVSSAGTSLAFDLPAGMTQGAYNVTTKVTDSPWSNELTVRVLPKSPAALTAKFVFTDTKKGIDLDWSGGAANSIVSGYEVERASGYRADSAEYKKISETTGKTAFDANLNLLTTKDIFYRIKTKFTDGTSVTSNVASVPACQKIAGNGPVKVVFMRDKKISEDLKVDAFYGVVLNTIKLGFRRTDPFKAYANKFSFYIDLEEYDTYDDWSMPEGTAKSQSECGKDAKIYIYYSTKVGKTAYSYFNSGEVYMMPFDLLPTAGFDNLIDYEKKIRLLDSSASSSLILAQATLHEVGHAFGRLRDEYIRSTEPEPSSLSVFDSVNCSTKPSSDFRSSINNQIYGSLTSVGCSYLKAYTGHAGDTSNTFYKPSKASLMDTIHATKNPDGTYITYSRISSPRFNVISCGYLISAILGEPTDKAHAQTHWQECATELDTETDTPPLAGKPGTLKSSSSIVYPGNAIKSSANSVSKMNSVPTSSDRNSLIISGSGFTPEGNNIRFANTATKKVFEINEVPSIDGKTLQLDIPNDTDPGTYNVRVGAFNSPWSDAISLQVLDFPKIASFSPASITLSELSKPILIKGSNFIVGHTVTVSFAPKSGGSAIISTAKVATSTKISVIPPASLAVGTYQVFVSDSTDGAKVETNKLDLGVYEARVAVPTISAASPAKAGPSASVALNGTHFTADSIVRIWNDSQEYSVTPTIASSTRLTFIVPANAVLGTYSVKVLAGSVGESTSLPFQILSIPNITSITPRSLANPNVTGKPIVLAGVRFIVGHMVDVVFEPKSGAASTPVSVRVASSTRITLSAPALSVGIYDVSVVDGSIETNKVAFTVSNGIPAITAMNPPAEGPGGTITVSGARFVDGIVLRILPGTTVIPAASTTVAADGRTLTFIVPSGLAAGSYALRAAVPGVGASNDFVFTILSGPVLTSAQASGGDQYSISGSNFVVGKTATVNFAPRAGGSSVLASAVIASSTQVSVNAVLPEGNYDVSMTVDSVTTNRVIFSTNPPILTSFTTDAPVPDQPYCDSPSPVTFTVTGRNFLASSVLKIIGAGGKVYPLNNNQVSADKASISAQFNYRCATASDNGAGTISQGAYSLVVDGLSPIVSNSLLFNIPYPMRILPLGVTDVIQSGQIVLVGSMQIFHVQRGSDFTQTWDILGSGGSLSYTAILSRFDPFIDVANYTNNTIAYQYRNSINASGGVVGSAFNVTIPTASIPVGTYTLKAGLNYPGNPPRSLPLIPTASVGDANLPWYDASYSPGYRYTVGFLMVEDAAATAASVKKTQSAASTPLTLSALIKNAASTSTSAAKIVAPVSAPVSVPVPKPATSTPAISIAATTSSTISIPSAPTPVPVAPIPVPAPTPVPAPVPAVMPITILPWSAQATIQAGKSLPYTLNWSGGPTEKTWKSFIHVVKGDGTTVAADAYYPSTPTTQWSGSQNFSSSVAIPPTLAPGTYRVMAGLWIPVGTTPSADLKLVPGSGVTLDPAYSAHYRYQVGTITVTSPSSALGAMISALGDDFISRFFSR
ncbi:MAG: hypothetical protein JWO73_916 [Candidatus Taylorbacteria bacterium]|nr:hypothetical protein [Candidatus Taylorbacteria bacterium]